ncbi:MAG: tetratricopeptide repeat protein [Bacteroidia bacterium]
MVNKPKNNIPSKEKLLAFIRGELSAKERMDIAKAIEENPFLADAVEGLRISEKREQNIYELEQKIRVKYQTKGGAKVISFQSKAILAAAASVLLLLSFGIYQKMLKLDEARVVSEQTYNNKNVSKEILKENETTTNSKTDAIEETKEKSAPKNSNNNTITEQTNIISNHKNIYNEGYKNNGRFESISDEENKVEQDNILSSNLSVYEYKNFDDGNQKHSEAIGSSDKKQPAAAPATAINTTTTREIREESSKANYKTYSLEETSIPVAQAENAQEKEKTKKSLTREVADQNIPFNQAIALHNRKNFEAAFSIMDSLAQKNPKNIEYQYYAGAFAYDNKSYNKAISYLEPISKDNKNNYQEASKWFLALSYKAIGKNEKAKSLLKDIASKNNNYQQMAADTLKTLE